MIAGCLLGDGRQVLDAAARSGEVVILEKDY
jgi:hypothetical protein